jgi:hypothetical protein
METNLASSDHANTALQNLESSVFTGTNGFYQAGFLIVVPQLPSSLPHLSIQDLRIGAKSWRWLPSTRTNCT